MWLAGHRREQHDPAGGVARRVHHLQLDGTHLEHVAIAQRREAFRRHADLRGRRREL